MLSPPTGRPGSSTDTALVPPPSGASWVFSPSTWGVLSSTEPSSWAVLSPDPPVSLDPSVPVEPPDPPESLPQATPPIANTSAQSTAINVRLIAPPSHASRLLGGGGNVHG